MQKLDIGCGRNKKSGYIGIDKSPKTDADYFLDIGRDTLPFLGGEIDQIYTAHTFEHLTGDELIFVMNECWRVLGWGGKMFIHVPSKDCALAWQDPTHRSYFVSESIKFFCGVYLVKYQLDYGIKCGFLNYETIEYYPNGEHEKDYCTMLQFSLKKDYSHFERFSKYFPFGSKRPAKYDSCFNCPILDPHKQARAGKLVGGVNFDRRESSKSIKAEAQKPLDFEEHTIRMAKYAFDKHRERILKIHKDAQKRYGKATAPLGLKGLFADLNRKNERLKQFMWEDNVDTSENIIDTLYDNAVYSILSAMYFEEEAEDGE